MARVPSSGADASQYNWQGSIQSHNVSGSGADASQYNWQGSISAPSGEYDYRPSVESVGDYDYESV